MINHLWLYLIYPIFALMPIFIWMFFYFKKDIHPEPKKMILKVFVLGMVAACIAAVFEMTIMSIFTGASLLSAILESFLLVALVEELVKYLVVKIYVFPSSEIDEPLDIMLYMVISALGFAALENIVLFFGAEYFNTIRSALNFALLRFVGAVFLHTLTSGTLGFFIAISFYSNRNKKALFFLGFLVAFAFHGFYNLAITQLTGFWQYSIPTLIIIILASFTTYGFVRLRRLKGACRISVSDRR